MTYATYFIAAPAKGKSLSFSQLETLAKDLLHEGWVRLPATIFVGGVAFEPRYIPRSTAEDEDAESSQEGLDYFCRQVAPHFIVPNAPEAMAGTGHAASLIWYHGADERAFLQALHRVPVGDHNVCVCFTNLSPQLSPLWKEVAAIYFLTRPAFIDFVEPEGYDAARLIHRGVTLFFTLTGHFPDVANNPLKPALERAFGTDLKMAQTSNEYYQGLRDARGGGEQG